MKKWVLGFAAARYLLWIGFCVEGVLVGVMVSYLVLDIDPGDWRFYIIPSASGPALAWVGATVVLRLYVRLKTRVPRWLSLDRIRVCDT